MKIYRIAQIKEEKIPHSIIFDPVKGIGAVPDNQNVNYKGFIKNMTPSQFLSLAAPIIGEPISAKGIEEAIRNGKSVANPFLEVDWDYKNKLWRVYSHEGRNRAIAIQKINPNTVIPVHIFPSKGMRARDITEEMKMCPFVPQGKTSRTKISL